MQSILCNWTHALSMLCLQLEGQGEQQAKHSMQVGSRAEPAVLGSCKGGASSMRPKTGRPRGGSTCQVEGQRLRANMAAGHYLPQASQHPRAKALHFPGLVEACATAGSGHIRSHASHDKILLLRAKPPVQCIKMSKRWQVVMGGIRPRALRLSGFSPLHVAGVRCAAVLATNKQQGTQLQCAMLCSPRGHLQTALLRWPRGMTHVPDRPAWTMTGRPRCHLWGSCHVRNSCTQQGHPRRSPCSLLAKPHVSGLGALPGAAGSDHSRNIINRNSESLTVSISISKVE